MNQKHGTDTCIDWPKHLRMDAMLCRQQETLIMLRREAIQTIQRTIARQLTEHTDGLIQLQRQQ